MATTATALFSHRRDRCLAIDRARCYHRGVQDALAHGERGLARQLGIQARRYRKRVQYHSDRVRWLESLCGW